jgi:hypothetical protein
MVALFDIKQALKLKHKKMHPRQLSQPRITNFWKIEAGSYFFQLFFQPKAKKLFPKLAG